MKTLYFPPLVLSSFLFFSCGQQEPVRPAFTPATSLTQFTTHEANERDAAWSPDGQWIAFGSMRSGNEDIWKKSAAGGEAVQLTFDEADDIYAVWLSDGKRLAFGSDRGGTTNVWTVSAEGGDARQVTADEDSVTEVNSSIVSWSPDGAWIAYTSVKGGDENIWVIPSEGGQARQVTIDTATDEFPSWSPDGREIAYTSDRGDSEQDIWIIPSGGGAARRLTTHPVDDWAPSWSPDGRWVIFTSMRSGNLDVWAVPAAGGTARQVTNTPDYNELVPRWSPDGRKIALNSLPSADLWVMSASGQKEVHLAHAVWDMSWSPDGREVAYIAADTTGEWRIWKVDASGGEPSMIGADLAVAKSLGSRVYSLDWSPDGSRIAFIMAGEGGGTNIWTLPAAGGEASQVTLATGINGAGRWSPDGSRIAFAGSQIGTTVGRSAGGRQDIWVVPSTGWKTEPLVDWSEDVFAPSWSPDGSKLAFESTRGLEQGSTSHYIWVVDLASGESTYLIEGHSPEWSPDGEKIVFGDQGLWTIPASGGVPTQLRETDDFFSYARWSPDGERLLVQSFPPGDIWTVDVSNW